MINNLHSERRKSIFSGVQSILYTNKDEIQHEYNIDFDKEILKRTKKKRKISFFKKYINCSLSSKTLPEF